jgi:hypothetical protein
VKDDPHDEVATDLPHQPTGCRFYDASSPSSAPASTLPLSDSTRPELETELMCLMVATAPIVRAIRVLALPAEPLRRDKEADGYLPQGVAVSGHAPDGRDVHAHVAQREGI